MSRPSLTAAWRTLAFATLIASGVPHAAFGADTETRLQLAERKLLLVSELVTRVDGLEREVQDLRGQVEAQQHELDRLSQQQRDFYQDLEQRIGGGAPALDPAPTSSRPIMPPPPPRSIGMPIGRVPVATMDQEPRSPVEEEPASEPMASEPPVVETEPVPILPPMDAPALTGGEQEYESAFQLLRAKRFAEAEVGFRSFIDNNPRHEMVANAHYWLAESAYAQGKADDALFEFDFLARSFRSSPKAPDALLKVGFILDDTQEYARARERLEKVVREYPSTTAARLARERLDRMAREGH